MNKQEYAQYDAVGLAELLKQKQVSPKELTKLAFERLEEVQPTLNLATQTRKKKALQEAEEMEKGSAPFAGVPTMLKDGAQFLPGEIASSGSKLLANQVAEVESTIVKKLREAGFLFLGHTNTPEFALKNVTEPKLFGPTRNPWNTSHSPGGSSGGAAAAIASGVVPVAGASDGGGSIRIPASYTGLVGLKPTRGRIPVGPGVGRTWHGAAIHFMLTKSVRDAAVLMNQLEAFQPEAAFHIPRFVDDYEKAMKEEMKKPLRIAFTTESPVGTPVSNDAKQAVMKCIDWLESLGHEVEEKHNGVDGIQLAKAYYMMNSAEMNLTIQRLENLLGKELTEEDIELEGWLLHIAGKSITGAEFSASLQSWDTAALQMAKLHETYDFYITPATANTAPKIGQFEVDPEQKEEYLRQIHVGTTEDKQELVYDMFLPTLTYTPFGTLANLTGQPAISLPVHLSEEGLPLGVQVIAPKGEEHRLLQLAGELEQSDQWNGLNRHPYFTTS